MGPTNIDRAEPGDLMMLAVDHGAVPMNIAAVLLLERGTGLDLPWLAAVLTARIGAVPRLRQRLVRTPPGCGRPIWVDDAAFDLAGHLSLVELEAPGSRADLLDAAARAVCSRLDPSRPLWSARLVNGVEGGHSALVLVLSHALADGVGGLAVLAGLSDGPPARRTPSFPAPPPSSAALARDALASRADALGRAPGALRAWAAGLRELGLANPGPVLAPSTSLNRPTGGRRRLTTVEVPRADVVAAAHLAGCTVNDLVLTAVTGAMAELLQFRGEGRQELVVSVPVSTRGAASAGNAAKAGSLGNHTGVVPLRIPIGCRTEDRLRHVAALTRAWRTAPAGRSTARRGQSSGPLGACFRLLAALRVFQPFINHQRLVNTFVTNVQGPTELVSLMGHKVLEVIPVAVNPGNVGVAFDVLSYGNQFVVTVVADPVVVPDQDLLTGALVAELSLLLRATTAERPT